MTDPHQIAREIAYELRGDQLPWSNRGSVIMDRELLSARIALALTQVEKETIERCARVAEEEAWRLSTESGAARERGDDATMYRMNTAWHSVTNCADRIRRSLSPSREETTHD